MYSKLDKILIVIGLCLILPTLAGAMTIKEKVGEAVIWVVTGEDEKLLYSTDPFHGAVFDTRDVSITSLSSGDYNITIRVLKQDNHSCSGVALSIFMGGYGCGFDWFNSPICDIEGIWRGSCFSWESVPEDQRHTVGLKGQINKITVEFYSRTDTPAEYDNLGNLIKEKEVKVKLLESWTLTKKNAAKVGWKQLLASGSIKPETEEALKELIDIKTVSENE